MAANRPVRRTRLAALFGAQGATAVAQAPRDAGALAITGLRATCLREPVSKRSYTVVRVETRSGLTGFGECGAIAEADALFERAREIVLGRPATAYEVSSRVLAGLGSIEAAITMALLDVVGRHAGAPVYQILGGPTRHKVRALTTLEGDTDQALVEALHHARVAGFRAFIVPLPAIKARIQGDAFVQATRRRLETLCAEGRDLDFVIGGGGALSAADAARVASVLEPLHPLWLDEPCPLENLRTIRKIAEESVTPLGFGKSVAGAGAVQDLLREETVDVLRPSLAHHGLAQIRRMAALAETSYVAVAPHLEGGPIATAAALHLAASLPNFVIQQIPPATAPEDRRMRDAVTGTTLEVVHEGYAALPTGAGLGIAVDERVLESYQDPAR
jgi:galactonate dehydratase